MANEGKERLVEAARRLIGTRGIAGATMRAIAQEAGLSTGAIYHYYANKEEVLYDVMAASLSESKRIHEEAERGVVDRDLALEQILLNIRKRFDKSEENQIQFHLAEEAILGDAELRGKFREKYREWIEDTEALMAFLHPEAPRGRAKALSSIMIGAIDGLILQLLLGANQAEVGELAAAYNTLVERCLPLMLEALAGPASDEPGGESRAKAPL